MLRFSTDCVGVRDGGSGFVVADSGEEFRAERGETGKYGEQHIFPSLSSGKMGSWAFNGESA